jgi:mono/diheme cytochrome c family protein
MLERTTRRHTPPERRQEGDELMWRRLATLLLSASIGAAAAYAADGDNPGKALYLRYCGACHGPEGKGDGIAGTFMRPKPIDLTKIAKKSGGDFPSLRVVETIDGRNTIRAHGNPDMPVWGEIFQNQANWDAARRVETRGKIMLITDYLRSIQEK